MRTNIDLDEHLISEAMELGGLSTKKAAVDSALREFVRIRRQLRAVDRLEGIGWEGDLEVIRDDSPRDTDWSLKAGE